MVNSESNQGWLIAKRTILLKLNSAHRVSQHSQYFISNMGRPLVSRNYSIWVCWIGVFQVLFGTCLALCGFIELGMFHNLSADGFWTGFPVRNFFTYSSASLFTSVSNTVSNRHIFVLICPSSNSFGPSYPSIHIALRPSNINSSIVYFFRTNIIFTEANTLF